MRLEELDLNLLLVFHLLLTEQRVGRVAERLGVSQPAVSNALARLRKLLGDELFVRTGQGMVPTPQALQLASAVTQALDLLQNALLEQRRFDPSTDTRTFTLGMTDIGEIVFLPALLEHLGQTAPHCLLRTVRHTALNLREGMEAGQIDLAIGLLPQLQAGFRQRRLFNQRYVCLFRQGHRLEQAQTLSTADYAAAEHIAVESPGTGHGQVDEWLQQAGVQRRVRLTVPHFVAVGHILAASDLVATIPARLAAHLAGPFGLCQRPHPLDLPDIPITLFWHQRVHRDSANQWLREQVAGLFAEPTAPATAWRPETMPARPVDR